MNKLALFLLAGAWVFHSPGQVAVPVVEWQGGWSGTSRDRLFALQQMPDGGYLLGGILSSGATGNKTAAGFGGTDFWLVRLDATGKKLWDKAFGGTGDDALFSLVRPGQ